MNGLKKVRQYLKNAFVNDKIYFYVIIAAIMTIVVECFSRRSLTDGLLFPFVSLIPYIVNMLIILFTYLLASLSKRKIFSLSLVSVIWFALAIVNCVLMSFRVTPLSAIDFYIFLNVISILTVYISIPEIILYSLLIVGAIVALVFLFIKTPKFPVLWKRNLTAISATIVIFVLAVLVGFSTKTLSARFPNLYNAYKNYGFTYCFSLSLVDHGIDKPDDYSENGIEEIIDIVREDGEKPEKTPNIIFVQLESFFDVNYLDNITLSENPIPTFTSLKEQYAHGMLTVPTIGAGTVNTEFEILTGMNMSYFGAGEYPYKSILSKNTCESIPYILADLGYTSTAIHNHEGSFYSRDDVYKNLGFDRFVSIEYMQNEDRNVNGWAKDSILTEHILKSLTSTDGSDFVFAVSVQAHGKYPTTKIDENQHIFVTDGIDSEALICQYEYYVNQLYGTDLFVKELVETVMALDEETVLVLYGDHLPSLSIDEESLSEGDLFTTEYAIIPNYDMGADYTDGKSLNSYQLSPYIMKGLGISEGYVNRLHQRASENEKFEEYLEALMYDVLYGEMFVLEEGEKYYSPTELKMGIDEIKVTSCERNGGVLTVKGENFTKYSTVNINGKSIFVADTVFVDSGTLTIKVSQSTNIEFITVSQVSDTEVVLSTSEKFYLNEN